MTSLPGQTGKICKVRNGVAPAKVLALRRGTWSKIKRLTSRITRTMTAFLVAVVLLKSSIVEAFFVPSASMGPTVLPKDYILVPKFYYGLRLPFLRDTVLQWKAPNRGEIIVFNRDDDPQTPADESKENLVKRVIGLPGDIIEMRGLAVFINGEPTIEPYAYWAHIPLEGDLSEYHWGPVEVPADSVFVLGDNRSASKDSRAWHIPFVKLARIQGKALVVYWSGTDAHRSGTVLR